MTVRIEKQRKNRCAWVMSSEKEVTVRQEVILDY